MKIAELLRNLFSFQKTPRVKNLDGSKRLTDEQWSASANQVTEASNHYRNFDLGDIAKKVITSK